MTNHSVQDGATTYFVLSDECPRNCPSKNCESICLDNLYNVLILLKKRSLFDSLFHSHISGAVCDFDKSSNVLTGSVNLASGTYYSSDMCNGECNFDCIRHVPSYVERRELHSQDLQDLLLYECKPMPPWIILVCVAVLLVIVMILSIILRRLITKKRDDKPPDPTVSQSQPAQKDLQSVAASEKIRDDTETAIQSVKLSHESVHEDLSVHVTTKSAESYKPKMTSTVSKRSKIVQPDSSEPVEKTKDVTVSKVRANTWLVEQVSEDQ